MEPVKTYVPQTTYTPTKTWSKKPYTPDVNRETKDERTVKQRMINRQSARRDAIDFLTETKGQNFTEKEVFEVAERFYDFVTK